MGGRQLDLILSFLDATFATNKQKGRSCGQTQHSKANGNVHYFDAFTGS